jgi:hypothetical protein
VSCGNNLEGFTCHEPRGQCGNFQQHEAAIKVIEAVSFLYLHEPCTVCQLNGSQHSCYCQSLEGNVQTFAAAIASLWKAMYKHFQLLLPANGRQGEGIFNVVASADGQLMIS